jgi:Tol biopolymer transport system component
MLYVIDREGSDLVSMEEIFNATGASVNCSPISWSPDGQWIAVIAGPSDEQPADILLVSAQGDAVENLTEDLTYEDIRACEGVDSSFLDTCLREMAFEQVPVWAPDGSALAVLIDHEIYLISRDGESYRRLTDQPGTPERFEWTPDSRQIVYTNLDGDGQIYSVSVETGEVRRIAEGNEPDLSPDGTKIVFTREEGGIYTVDFSGENLDHIVAGEGYYSLRWTPDGQFISYMKFADRKFTVFIVPRDGSWEKVIVDTGLFWNNEIAWSK